MLIEVIMKRAKLCLKVMIVLVWAC